MQHRYNEFVELDKQLTSLGLLNLPKLPEAFLFATETNLKSRRASLTAYLNELLSRKDTKHSAKLRLFLELDKFCPELMYKAPFRIVMQQFAQKRHVTHCFYIDSLDIYLLQVLNQQTSAYYLEVYTMNFRFEGKNTG